MNEASKTLLMNTVREWTKFVNERERMRGIATEVSAVARKIVLEGLTFLKAQNVDVECQDAGSMKIMGHPVVIEPIVEAIFPNVRTKVEMICSGANRAIVINQNSSISAGGNPFMFDQLKKGIPDSFVTNAAEFVSDSFLFVARSQTPEEQLAALQQSPAPAAAPQQPKPAQAVPPPQPTHAVPLQPAHAAPPQPPHAAPPHPGHTAPPQPPHVVPPQAKPAQPPVQPPRPAQPPRPPGPKPPGT